MNERLDEIEKQSYTEVMHERGGTYMAFDKAKFAELIVKECANIDFRRKVGLTADDHYEISKVIKQHFGVEE